MKYYKLQNLCVDIIDCPHSTPEWKKEGVRVVRNFNLKNGNIDFSDGYYVDEETYLNRIKRAIPEAGDIIISREAPMGVVGIVPENLKCCLGQRLVLLKVDKSKCNPFYLLFMLMSNFVQTQFKRADATGSIVSNLCIPDLKEIIIPMVDSGQENIAKLLEAINNKMLVNNKINDNLEQQAKLLYDYWFSQFDFPDKNGKPYCSAGGKMVWNEQLKRNIPENWKVVPLSTVLNFKSGFSFSSDLYVTEGKYKLLTIKNVQDSGINLNVDNYINDVPSNVPDYCFLKVNDILMSLTGNVGRIGIMYDSGCLLNQRVALAKSVNEDLHSFVYFLLKSDIIRKQYETIANGSSQKNLSPVESENILIAYNEQIAIHFASVTNKHLKIIVSNLAENEKLIHLRDWLLPMLMNGQATISD